MVVEVVVRVVVRLVGWLLGWLLRWLLGRCGFDGGYIFGVFFVHSKASFSWWLLFVAGARMMRAVWSTLSPLVQFTNQPCFLAAAVTCVLSPRKWDDEQSLYDGLRPIRRACGPSASRM